MSDKWPLYDTASRDHLHAIGVLITEAAQVVKGKGIDRKDPAPPDHHIPLAGLRQMGDDAHATHGFGWHLWSYMKLKLSDLSAFPEEVRQIVRLSPLPQKPPLPRSWALYSQPPPAASPPQPKSSEA